MEETLRWPIYGINSFRAQTERKRPTICLLEMRLYSARPWQPVDPGTTEKSSSKLLLYRCWKGLSCIRLGLYLSGTSVTESKQQLQVLTRLLSTLRFLLTTFRFGFWKKFDFASLDDFALGLESQEESWFCRFSAWFIKASHLAAGSLSSITNTFPAFKGTIS